jgi:hypothetical protein
MDTYVLQQINGCLSFQQQMKSRITSRQWNKLVMEEYGDLLKQPLNMDRMFKKAFLRHHLKLVLFFINTQTYCHQHHHVGSCARELGPDHIIENNREWGLKYACSGGHRDLVDLMLSKGATNYDWGLWSSCRGGHPDLVKLMISKGAIGHDWGLWEACRGGHRDLVELMLSKGTTYYNWGLSGACHGGHPDLVKLMISKGADCCVFCEKSISEH